jgi:enamine deaminase RidA (YjgF/YER057c/UK114 family)
VIIGHSMEKPDFDRRIEEMGIVLPAPPDAFFTYVPALISGSLLYVSGQIGVEGGKLKHTGQLGVTHTIEEAQEAARLCGLNILSQVRKACGGSLNRVSRCLRITGYVNAPPGCKDHAQALEGCSRLMQQVFGDVGRHTRVVVGVSSLPFDASIEIESIFELHPGPLTQPPACAPEA